MPTCIASSTRRYTVKSKSHLGYPSPATSIPNNQYPPSGHASNWSASRQPRESTDFRLQHFNAYNLWLTNNCTTTDPGLSTALFFTGEMVYPTMLDDYTTLRSLKDVANILATWEWKGKLYDLDRLAENTVPVYSATYMDDMYVDFGLTRRFAEITGGFQEFVTNRMQHNAVRVKTEEVVEKLWELRMGCVD
ncbi:hypothetical protein ABW19_dt0200029 [Dactylella cylindrospora]|nr:hypothetical protein ABW19_dt0200029 [Dactylella cylindrospora]